jgi:hypothetical protein
MIGKDEIWMPDLPNVSRRAVRWTLCIVAVAFIIFVIARLHDQYFCAPRVALPSTATDVHLYQSPSSGFTGDYYDILRARINEQDFPAYAKRLNLTPMEHNPDQLRGYFAAFRKEPHPWWEASDQMDGVYHNVETKSSTIVIAKYEKGSVYYIESWGYGSRD